MAAPVALDRWAFAAVVIGLLGLLSICGSALEYRVNPSDLCQVSMVHAQPGGSAGPTLLLVQGVVGLTSDPCGRVMLATAMLAFSGLVAGPFASIIGTVRIFRWIRRQVSRETGWIAVAALLLGLGCWFGDWVVVAVFGH